MNPSQAPTAAAPSPVLVYDGDCGFCRYWVEYWRALTGPRIDYQPYQQVAERYPAVTPEDFQRAIYLFAPDGTHTHGAEAAFRVLAVTPGRGLWLWLYRHLPGYALFAETVYRVIARRRVASARLSRWLWGPQLEPPRYALVAWVFLRLLGLIYLAAFVSFGSQAQGLIGSNGVTPLVYLLGAVREQLGAHAYWQLPSIFWLADSDAAIRWVGILGALAAVLLVCGILQRLMLVALYVLYLSILYAGQAFMSFQWDLLLLEAGFLAIFLPGAAGIVVWVFRWVTFRFVFMAGAAKLLSQDPTWRALTALDYHFETQPLPTPLAWYAHHLPELLLRVGTAGALLVELVLVFLIFLPRRLRFLAAWSILLFQTSIALTGNYNFFNLLAMVLCVTLFDDAALRSVLPGRVRACLSQPAATAYRPVATSALAVLAVGLVTLGLVQMYEQIERRAAWAPLDAFYAWTAPLRIANGYGLFANMTTSRPEIVIEGSNDRETWEAYEFRYKPGDLQRRPGWNLPHQPRVDWQMWFAALGSASANPWFDNLLVRLLQGSPEVLALLGPSRFANHPPRYIRAQLYDYHYSTPALRRATGQWWTRELIGSYFPVISLEDVRGHR